MSGQILLVEDSSLLTDLISGWIREWGHSVITVGRGEDALDALERGRIDVVVTDLGLPTMSGHELIREIRRNGWNVPVIVLSAASDKAAVLEAVHHGVSDFVDKDEHPHLLRTAIERAIDRLRLVHENRALLHQLRAMNEALEAQVRDRTRAVEEANRQLRAEMSERLRAEAELNLSQKLEAVGRLAAGVAHEINTPIQFVTDSAQFMREATVQFVDLLKRYRQLRLEVESGRSVEREGLQMLADAEEQADLDYLLENAQRATERIIDGLGRVSSIVRAMKEFAHPDRGEKVRFDLNRAIESTLTMTRNEYKYVAELESDFGDIPPILGFPGEINQVILNLVVNAAHAIEDVVAGTAQRGRIVVRTHRAQDSVVVSVADTGSGISESVQPRIFEPFFTTKGVGKGTGQGLAIARSAVVDKHGGELSFETEPGQGTTFFVRLPIDG